MRIALALGVDLPIEDANFARADGFERVAAMVEMLRL